MDKFIIGKLYICNTTKLAMSNVHIGEVFIAIDKETLTPVCLNPHPYKL